MNTKIKKINDLINEIITGQKKLKCKNLVLSHLYKRLEQLENE